MNHLVKGTFKYLERNSRRCQRALSQSYTLSQSTKYLSYKPFSFFGGDNKPDSIQYNQSVSFLNNESELYIENTQTRMINDLVSKGKLQEAVLKCKEVLGQSIKADEGRVRYLLAYCLKQLGQTNEAIEAFTNFIKVVKNAGYQQNERDKLAIFVEVSHLELAILYQSIGNTEACLKYIEEAIQLNPLYTSQSLIETYIAGRQISRGIDFLRKTHERVPGNEQILFLLGFLQEANGDIEAALQSYQKLIDLSENGKHPQANLQVGMILKRKGDYETSTCYLMRTVESDPNNYKARFNLGQNLRYLGEGMLGKENLEVCLELEPLNPLPYYDLALCCEQGGEMEKCIEYLQKNVERNETHSESYLRLANIFAARREKQQALNYIKKSINSDDFFRENINSARVLQSLLEDSQEFSQGNSSKIKISNEQLNSSVQLKTQLAHEFKCMADLFCKLNHQENNKKCEIFNSFTQLFLLTNQLELAIESEKKLVEFNVNVLQHRVNLAQLYRNQLQFTQAIHEYEELIKLEPEEGNYHYFLAQIQLQSGLVKEAITSYSKSLNVSGENDYSLFELYHCYKLNGQTEEANHCKTTLLQYFPGFFEEEKPHIQYIESLHKK